MIFFEHGVFGFGLMVMGIVYTDVGLAREVWFFLFGIFIYMVVYSVYIEIRIYFHYL